MQANANVVNAGAVISTGWIRWLFIGALVAGAFDISYATSISYFRSGIAPSRILQSVASGVLGPDSYQGGTATAALGLGLHFVIAFIITCVFFAAASRQPVLTAQPLVSGALYGAIAYAVMNYIVVPFSRIGPRATPATPVWVTGVLVHMFLIGVPIALAARRGFDR
jgi:hypothetical protein